MAKPQPGHKKIGGVRHRMGKKRPYHKSMTGHHRALRQRLSPMYASVRDAFAAARRDALSGQTNEPFA